MAESVISSVTAGEVLQPGTTIELRASRSVDPRFAQGAVRLVARGSSRAVNAGVSARGRLIRLSTEGLAPGAYDLVVSELLGAKGERLVERMVIPFVIAPVSGKVPSDLRTEHAVRLHIGDLAVQRLAPGETARAGHVDVVKAVGRKDGQPVQLAFDEGGSSGRHRRAAGWRRASPSREVRAAR